MASRPTLTSYTALLLLALMHLSVGLPANGSGVNRVAGDDVIRTVDRTPKSDDESPSEVKDGSEELAELLELAYKLRGLPPGTFDEGFDDKADDDAMIGSNDDGFDKRLDRLGTEGRIGRRYESLGVAGRFGKKYDSLGVAGRFGKRYDTLGVAGRFGKRYDALGVAGRFGKRYDTLGVAGSLVNVTTRWG